MDNSTKQEPKMNKEELTPDQIEKMIIEKVAARGDSLTKDEQKQQISALKKVFIQGLSPRLAMGFSSDFMKIVYNHSYNLYNAGKYQEANEFFKMLVQLDPTIPDYYMGLAASYQKLGKFETAIQCYYTLAFVDQTTPIPYYHIASCYEELNNPMGVILSLGGAIQRAGENPHYEKIKARSLALLEGWKSKLGIAEIQTEKPLPTAQKIEENKPDIFGQLQDSVRKKNNTN